MLETHHLMELPRRILIGETILQDIGEFIRNIIPNIEKISIITGNTVKEKIHYSIEKSLNSTNINYKWRIRGESSHSFVNEILNSIKDEKNDLILGVGGGKSVDIGKMVAYGLSLPFISIPTSASHDGMASPFVSLKGIKKPYSIKVNTPLAVLADIELMSHAPLRLLKSGCGDLIAKITAVKDWELARDEKDEYFGEYAANLALLSANMIIEKSKNLMDNTKKGLRIIVEGLISAGVSAGIAGSSRPCSGSEHLFSHAVEYIVKKGNCGLHGERVGIGTIMMAKLHNLDWELIVETLENIGAPTKAKEINLTETELIDSLIIAQSLRPERFTILSKEKLDRNKALELARSVKII